MNWSWQGNRPMTLFGLAVLAALVLYYVFVAINGLALPTQSATATVTGKSYREAGQTYNTIFIDNRPLIRGQPTPEIYVLELQIGNQKAEGTVTKGLYGAVSIGAEVKITYQHRRLTGSLLVLEVRR